MMTEDSTLIIGSIKETDDIITYEIPRIETNLIEPEQLEELKREENAFFKCQHYIVDDSTVRVLYKKEADYTNLKHFQNASEETKKKIALHLLDAIEMLGTQYTTFIHPANIYVNQIGHVKYAHRGIRSVLPPETLALPELIRDIKKVVIYLYTSYRFSELDTLDMTDVTRDNHFLTQLQHSSSVNELREVIDTYNPKKIIKTAQPKSSPETVKQEGKSKHLLTKVGLFFAGMALIAIVLYFFLINPQNNRISSLLNKHKHDQQAYQDKTASLEQQLKEKETLISAYHAVVQDDPERAVNLFESMDHLNESDEVVLIEQYLNLNTVESLTKVIERDESYAVPVVERLIMLNTDEANEAILSIESSEPEILLEKAWLDQNLSQVISIYETIPDDNRAKYLAAYSYLEENNAEKAMSLAKELDNKKLQIASYEKEKALIEQNKKLDKKEKKEKIDDINKKIKKLK